MTDPTAPHSSDAATAHRWRGSLPRRRHVLTLGLLLSSFACASSSNDGNQSSTNGGSAYSQGGSSGTNTAGGSAGTTSTGTGALPAVTGGSPTFGGVAAFGAAAGIGTAPTFGGVVGAGNAAGTSGSAGSGGSAGAGAHSSFGGSAGSGAGAGEASTAGGGSTAGGAPAREGPVENGSADCRVPALKEASELTSIAKLPDPFLKLDGTRLGKRSEWRCRRQEILEQAQKYIYGEKPAFDAVSGDVTNTKIEVHVEAEGNSIDFSASVKLPSKGSAPHPAIINIGTSGLTLGESRILDQGVAVIYFDHTQLGREGQVEASRGKPNAGKFYDLYGGDHSAGLLMAWAWGVSRMIDVIQASGEGIIDVNALGVTGCSRHGKGAFAVGVFDERIALTIPHETSTAGVPAYRIVDVLNTERTDHNFFGLNWLGNDFEPFVYRNGSSNAVKLPIDSHSLIASVAPRGILILENPDPTQMSAQAGSIAAQSALDVFGALGIQGNLGYHSNVSGTHCAYKNEYSELISQMITRFLKHEGVAPGKIDASSKNALMLADWKDWQAPELEADVTFE